MTNALAKPERKKGNWWAYAIAGDEWLLAAHALQAPVERPSMAMPGYFAAGQAFELYVKCTVARDGGDASPHLGIRLWESACAADGFPLRDAVRTHLVGHEQIFNWDKEPSLPKEDLRELADNIGLYLAMGHLVDLKYLFAGTRLAPARRGLYMPMPEIYFLKQIHDLRRWVGHVWDGTAQLDHELARLG